MAGSDTPDILTTAQLRFLVERAGRTRVPAAVTIRLDAEGRIEGLF